MKKIAGNFIEITVDVVIGVYVFNCKLSSLYPIVQLSDTKMTEVQLPVEM